MENRGHISISENDQGKWIVEARLVDGDLWLTKHQMADLLGVYVNTIGNNLRAIFNSGIIHEDKVSHIYKYESGGKEYRTTLYNLEALIFVSYRIKSFQARAFREWVTKRVVGQTGNARVSVFVQYDGKSFPN